MKIAGHPGTARVNPAQKPPWVMRTLEIWLNLMASVHLVWFYVNRVPSYLNLERYELGQERMPFQARLLLMYPLHWAHNCVWLQHAAAAMATMYAWFPRGVRPEGLLEAVVDLACVAAAGLVARSLYRAASPTRIFLPAIYPLSLVMIALSYCLPTMHHFRYIYDLPSLGFFALGLFVIYFRKPFPVFALIFLAATLNRETSLFLLAFYAVTFALDAPSSAPRERWMRLLTPRALLTLVPLMLCWLGWRIYMQHHFRINPSESLPRLVANIFLLLWPLVWPQIFGAAAYLLPLILIFWKEVDDHTIRAWRWIIPFWIAFMMFFGILLEIRLFGELIPVFVCVAALTAEKKVIASLRTRSLPTISL